MNHCNFNGRIVDELHLSEENNVKVLRFTMSVDQYRKKRTGKKFRDRNYLYFEAWDTGAQTIYDNCDVGDCLSAACTARNIGDKIVFRINEFTIFRKSQILDEN